MPPKTKGKKKAVKGKSSTVVDGLSTEEMSKDQLEEHIIRLREELDREREERSYFQLERDKIQASWEISKRILEETKAELRNRQREREEAEDRHKVEITVYKQKLKHVLSEQHNTISEMKIDNIAANSLIQSQHTESTLGMRGEVYNLQADLRMQMFNNQNCIKELQLKHQVELMELSNDYDKKIKDIREKCYQELLTTVEAETKKKKRAELLELKDRWTSHMGTLMKEHSNSQRLAEESFSKAQRSAMSFDKEQSEVKLRLERTKKNLSAAKQEIESLHKCLEEKKDELTQTKMKKDEYRKACAEMMNSMAEQKVMKKKLEDLMMENVVLQNALQKAQQERDDLLKKQRDTILDVQQRRGLKEMLLERKLVALTETLQKKEAQLCASLSFANPEPTAADSAANRLEEIMESKHVTISAVKEDFAAICEEYEDLLEKNKALGGPLHNFPFKISAQILTGGTQAQNLPAALEKHLMLHN